MKFLLDAAAHLRLSQCWQRITGTGRGPMVMTSGTASLILQQAQLGYPAACSRDLHRPGRRPPFATGVRRTALCCCSKIKHPSSSQAISSTRRVRLADNNNSAAQPEILFLGRGDADASAVPVRSLAAHPVGSAKHSEGCTAPPNNLRRGMIR